MTPYRRRHRQSNGLLFLALIMAFLSARSCRDREPAQQRPSRVSTPVENPIEDVLRPAAGARYQEGIAAAILIDPLSQGLALSLAAGEVASLLISRMAVPVLYAMAWRRRQRSAPPASVGSDRDGAAGFVACR